MTETGWTTDQIAARIAQDIPDGAYVNLGIGRPEKVANHIPPTKDVILHTENGLLGMGPAAGENEIDLELINAGKKPVTVVPGAAYFHHADSFAMIRGGHIDICVMGGYQVSCTGDLANWSTGDPSAMPAVGGAMDLSVGTKSIFVLMSHLAKDGSPKLVSSLSYPATAIGVVDTVYTDFAIIDIRDNRFNVRDIFPGLSLADLAARTGADLQVN